MEFTLSALVWAFVYSVPLGAAFAVMYEPVRLLHLCGFRSKLCYFVCDVLFMLLCGIITYLFSIVMLEGRVRFFVIVGEIVGFCVFACIFRPLLNKIYTPLIKLFEKIFENLLKLCRKVMYNVLCDISLVYRKLFSLLKRHRVDINEKKTGHKRREKRGGKFRADRRNKTQKEEKK